MTEKSVIYFGKKCNQNGYDSNKTMLLKRISKGTSLVAQWLGVHLPMQGTRVRSLVWEDPKCH